MTWSNSQNVIFFYSSLQVISDIIKCSILETPFYLNLSTWGPVRPAGVVGKGTAQRDDNGNNIEYTEKVEVHDTNGIAELNDQSPKRRKTIFFQ